MVPLDILDPLKIARRTLSPGAVKPAHLTEEDWLLNGYMALLNFYHREAWRFYVPADSFMALKPEQRETALLVWRFEKIIPFMIRHLNAKPKWEVWPEGRYAFRNAA